MAAKKTTRGTKSGAVAERVEGKFYAWAPDTGMIPGTRVLQAGHVLVGYRPGDHERVARLFESHKRATWESMAKRLAKIDACFVPWGDGKPGHHPAYA